MMKMQTLREEVKKLKGIKSEYDELIKEKELLLSESIKELEELNELREEI